MSMFPNFGFKKTITSATGLIANTFDIAVEGINSVAEDIRHSAELDKINRPMKDAVDLINSQNEIFNSLKDAREERAKLQENKEEWNQSIKLMADTINMKNKMKEMDEDKLAKEFINSFMIK